jgi:rifampin ADP-ribosylating transferase
VGNLNPAQFFHGTTARLRRGDVVLPSQMSGKDPTFTATDSRFAYASQTKDTAWHWAERAWLNRGDGVPRVYAVEPLGPVETDPRYDDHGNLRGVHDDDRRSTRGFRVLKRYSMPPEMGPESEWED